MYYPRQNKSKDKSFSSRGKIEKYNQDGSETIIMMGRPFRVVQKIGETASSSRHKQRSARNAKEGHSYVFLVENAENMPEFPRHLALKRSFFNVNEVLDAHREPEMNARIKDKSIARVFHSEVTRSEGKLGVTVAMEYCSSNLYRRLKQENRLSESDIVHVLLSLTSAVGYIHSLQPPIAHRDIRPENILIHSGTTGAAAYRLCNFSSATTEAYQCENREEAAMATEDIEKHTTPAFRAPEMADPSSGKRIDEKADLWSIGVLLYYMMFLRLPFPETNMGLAGRPKLHIPSSMGSAFTGSLRVVLEHLLEPDPAQRWDVFALTNFLRFDEDISRHLGTFFFTATEWPEGWEQQEVKVVRRAAPPKAPPIRHESGGRTVCAETTNATHADPSAPSHMQRAGATASRRAEGPNDTDDADAAAIAAALGMTGSRSERERFMREQREAWERAEAERHAKQTPPQTREETKATGEMKPNAEPNPPRAGEERKAVKKDLFDDLFDSAPTPTPSAPGAPQQGQQQMAVNEAEKWKDSLFHNAQPQQQPQQPQPYAAIMDNSGWGTGAPVGMPSGMSAAVPFTNPPGGYGGVYTPHGGMPPYQQQQPQPQQMQGFPYYSGTDTPPQPQQTLDFMQGNYGTPSPKKEEAPPKQEKKKDPFEDLFS